MTEVFQDAARPFLYATMKYITNPNTNSLVITAACNFSSILLSSPLEFYQFFIQLDENERAVINGICLHVNGGAD
jgi:hypothetical protein